MKRRNRIKFVGITRITKLNNSTKTINIAEEENSPK